VVGLTIVSRGEVPGKTREKIRRRNNNDDNNNNKQISVVLKQQITVDRAIQCKSGKYLRFCSLCAYYHQGKCLKTRNPK
jgi:uncharacterized secreted protein with C-terminal beta-propeller domain